MSKLACNICHEDYLDTQTLIKHFTKEHSTTKCHLCAREAATNGNFCPTCHKAFPGEIANLELQISLLSRTESSLKKLQNSITTHKFLLREKFLLRRAELFCTHEIPKDNACPKCEKFNAREIHKTVNIIRISLDAFKPATFRKHQTRITP